MHERVILLTGIASERSLAAACARELAAGGARLLCTWQGERERARVEPLCAELPGEHASCRLCIGDDASLRSTATLLRERFGRVDGLLHAISFARYDEQQPGMLEIDRERFHEAMEISARSLLALSAVLDGLWAEHAAICALSYIGARRAVPGYDLMGLCKAALEAEVRYLAADLGPRGLRVNALSAGPVRTPAASGVPGFAERLRAHAERAPLRRNIRAEEVAAAAAFLLGPAASAITGQILHVDAGASVL